MKRLYWIVGGGSLQFTFSFVSFQNSKAKVVVIGHSFVPSVLRLPNAEVTILRKPGGTTSDLKQNPFYRANFEEWDVAVIHLGGNDLRKETPGKCFTILCKFIKNLTVKKVILVEPERRIPKPANRVSPSYASRGTRLSKLMRDHCRFQEWDVLRLRKNEYFQHICSDGVHLNIEGNRLYVEEMKRLINKAIRKYQF